MHSYVLRGCIHSTLCYEIQSVIQLIIAAWIMWMDSSLDVWIELHWMNPQL